MSESPLDCQRVEREGLIELYLADRLPDEERDAFEGHYFECDRCFAALETARRIRAGFAESAGTAGSTATADRGARSRWWLPTAALAAAAALAALIVFGEGDDDRLAPLGAIAPTDLPVYVETRLRGDTTGDGWAEFESGMEAYSRGEWERAAERLTAAVGADSTRVAWRFYLGAALMGDDRPEDALPHLRAAAERDGLSGDARWLLGKAWLRLGEPDSARAALQSLAASDAARASEARDLLDRLERADASD